MHTPLVLRWREAPGRVGRDVHNDVAPTLLGGCSAAESAADYASGQDLFSDRQWEWLIARATRTMRMEPER